MSNNNLNNVLSNATNLSSILNALVSISSIEDINTLIPPSSTELGLPNVSFLFKYSCGKLSKTFKLLIISF